MLTKLDAWHRTKTGLLVFAGLELALCFYLSARALDTGSPLYYLLLLVFLYGFLHNTIKFMQLLFVKGSSRAKHR